MFKDVIVEEVRKNRQDILESYKGDIKALMQAAMKNQWKRGHKVVSARKKIIQQGVAPNAYPLRRQA